MAGQATGKNDEASGLVASLNSRLDAIKSKVGSIDQSKKPPSSLCYLARSVDQRHISDFCWQYDRGCRWRQYCVWLI